MGLKIDTVTASIAALTPSGVTMKDSHEVPQEVTTKTVPIFFPDPDGFVSGLRIERAGLGVDSSASKDVAYTLNYIFLFAAVGSGRYVTDLLSGMITKAVLILNAFADNSSVSGAIDINARVDGDFGVLNDIAGNEFHGCMIAVDVLEFYEVA